MANNISTFTGSGVQAVVAAVGWIYAGWQRWNERRQLQRIDLYDISLSRRADIEQEAEKPWWVE